MGYQLQAKYTVARGISPIIERKLPIEHITGEKDATGSGDAVVIDVAAYELQVHDLKFGRGVKVSAEKNEQLAMYLAGAWLEFGEFCDFQRFRGVIHQPRIDSEPDEYVWSREELLAFAENAKQKAKLARVVKQGYDSQELELAEGIEAHLVPGDKQCQFCDAKATCPALQRTVQETVLAEFVDLDAAPVVVKQSQLVAIPADSVRLANLLAMVPLIESWCDHITAHAEAEALAGRPVPGWKLVQGKRGNRAWRSKEEAEKALKSMRLKQEQMYSFELITPTAAEKLTKGDDAPLGDRQWKKLQELITQADGKPTLVPESDKRPALEIKPVVDEFAALPAEVQPEELV